MDDAMVLFRYTEHAFALTGWGVFWIWAFIGTSFFRSRRT